MPFKISNVSHKFLALIPIAFLAIGIISASSSADNNQKGYAQMSFNNEPQMKTSARLLKIGESIKFTFNLPKGISASSLAVYPRYLESAKPGKAFKPGGSLDWVNKLHNESFPIKFVNGSASFSYTPTKTGSYLAVWQAGDETFYRYFSVIDDSYIVLSFSPFMPLEPDPTLHATGIPLDYRLPAEDFNQSNNMYNRFISYNRLFGDNIIPMLPDTPDMNNTERFELYKKLISNARSMMPDQNDTRSAWLEKQHMLDPGYIKILAELGINDHCGLWCANAEPWLGMPEFPYFSSNIDCRKMSQLPNSKVVSHQWDFCGSWHFLGPVSWHFKVSEGNWKLAEKNMLKGIKEFENLTQMSGHPSFVNPLYEALDVGIGYPNPDFEIGTGEPRNFNGAIDDAFISKSAMSPDEIKNAMSDGLLTVKDMAAGWTFDDKNPNSTNDLGKNENNLEFIGGSSKIKGRAGKAVYLDGKDGYLVSKYPIGIGSGDFTMGCWIKPEPKQRMWTNIMSSHNTGGGNSYRGVSFEQDGEQHNKFRLTAGIGDGWYFTPSVQLKPNEWQHLAAVKQDRTITIYLNGVQIVKDELAPNAAFMPAADRFRIGDWTRGTSDPQKVGAFEKFIDRYQRFIAFDLPKKHKVAFARSIDAADYYIRHYKTTPKTVFSSKTDDVMYDIWWTYQWDMARYWLVTRERLPWLTKVSKVPRIGFKDPLSYEFILVEDPRWSIRFERECPNPIWRFDYRVQKVEDGGSAADLTDMPDVHIPRAKWIRNGNLKSLRLKMNTDREFKDYAIAIWGLPKDINIDAPIKTNAKEYLTVKNTDNEYHLVLFFDLTPGMELWVEAFVKE